MRPRILYVVYWGAAEPLGQSLVVPAVERLAAGADLTVITFEKPADLQNARAIGEVRDRMKRAGVRWVALQYHKRPKLPATAYDIAHGIAVCMMAALRSRPDIVHGRTFIGGIIGRAVSMLLRVPFVYHNEGFYPDEQVDGGVWREGSLPHRVARAIETRLYRSADAILCMSRRSRKVLEPYGVPTLVVPSCVDLDHFARTATSPTPGDGLRLIYIGSVGKRYILDRIARFVRIASEVVGDVHLRILSGADRDLIFSMVETGGLPRDVWTLDTVPHTAVPQELAAAHAGMFFLQKGISEFGCSPTKIGEYWAMGIPVITTAGVSDTDDIIRELAVGVIITEHTDEAYRRAAMDLQRLLADPQLAARCRTAAERYYSLAPRCDDQLALYSQLLHHRGVMEPGVAGS